MNITVTGCLGRVGREVVRRLVADGHAVRGVDLRERDGSYPSTAAYLQTDLLDPELAAAAVTGADVVVHLAAYMSWNHAEAAKLFRANVDAGFTLLDAVRSTSRAQLVVASSGEVYPEGKPKYLPIDEQHPREPRSVYGMTKLLLEDMVWFYARTYDMPATVIRLPHTQDAAELLDPASPFSGPRFFLREKLAQQRAFGNEAAVTALIAADTGAPQLLLSRGEDGTPYRMPIADTRDTAAGILAAVSSTAARGHTIALGPAHATDFTDALQQMSEVTGLPVATVNLPGPAVSYTVDISLARQLLGFEPRYDFGAMLREAGEAFHTRSGGQDRIDYERSSS